MNLPSLPLGSVGEGFWKNPSALLSGEKCPTEEKHWAFPSSLVMPIFNLIDLVHIDK
jgi:hypothetical protein